MKIKLYTLLFALISCAGVNASSTQYISEQTLSSSSQKEMHKKVKQFKSFKFDRNAFANIGKDPKFKMSLGSSYDWDITFEQNKLSGNGIEVEYTDRYGTKKTKLTSQIYKGKTERGEEVRLAVGKNKIAAVIIDKNGKETMIKQAKELLGNDDESLVVYEQSDVTMASDRASNGSDTKIVTLPAKSTMSYDEIGCNKVLEIAVDVDYEFYKKMNYSLQNVYDEVLFTLNAAEAAFEKYFSMTFTITNFHVWTSNSASNYPYNKSYDALSMILSQQNYWSHQSTRRDIVHLFSGNPVYGTYGISCCSPNQSVVGVDNGYSLSYYRTDMYKTTTHEIGHNMGAEDANLIGASSSCQCGSSSASIMCQGDKSDSQWFCEVSIGQIKNGIAYAGDAIKLPNSLNITSAINGILYEGDAQNTITASNKITNNATVKYQSGGKILLKSGFSVKSQSKFKGIIKHCDALRSGQIPFTDNLSIDDEIIDDDMTSVEEALVLSPNPTTGEFTIFFDSETEDGNSIVITDVTGKVVYTAENLGSKAEINLSGKAQGVYIVKAIVNGNVQTEKLILK